MEGMIGIDNAKVTYVRSKNHAHCAGGRCSACGGTGLTELRLSCPFCNGLGTCPRCHGTGKCAGCDGVGSTPNPRGSEKCYLCHGEGMVSVERAEVRWAERCPVCRMSVVSDGNFCSYCGIARKCPKCGKEWLSTGDTCESCGYKRGTKPS